MPKKDKFDTITKVVGKFYRINQYIQAAQVRVVDEKGMQIGVMPIFNAIQKARELGVDLVEVSGGTNPPVCKLIDFKKFKYIEAKKEQEEKKGAKKGEIKEIQLSPFIAKNDLEFRIKRTREFITDGNKVKLRVRFSGREIAKKDFGYKIIDTIVQNVSDIAGKDSEAKLMGKEIFLILSPSKGKKKKEESNI